VVTVTGVTSKADTQSGASLLLVQLSLDISLPGELLL
jgi:hypothetical protein